MVRRKNFAIQAVIAAVGAIATVYIYNSAIDANNSRVAQTLETRAEWRAVDLAWKIDRAIAPVMAIAGIQARHPDETEVPLEKEYVAQLRDVDLLRTINWLPRVKAEERDAFERKMREAGYADFQMLEPAGPGRFAPAPPRAEYFPIFEGWVLDGPPASLGVNALFNPSRVVWFEKARDSGLPTLSDPILSTATNQFSIFYIVPVYRSGKIPQTVEERRTELRGYTIGVSEVSRLLNKALENTPTPRGDIYISVADDTAAQTIQPFAHYRLATGRFESYMAPLDLAGLKGDVVTQRIETVNRTWTVVSHYSPDVVRAYGTPVLWGVLLVGFAVTGLLMAIFYREALEIQRAQTAVAEATRESNRSAAFLRTVLDSTRDAVVSIDDRGMIVAVNRTAEQVFGYASDELIGHNVKMLMPEPYRSGHDGYLKSYRDTGVAKIIGIGREVEGRRKDGSVFPVDLTMTEMRIGDQRGYVGTMRDLTSHKKLEAQLVQAQKMEAVGQLTGGVAHDFNNLLGVIVGNLDLVDGALGELPDARKLVQRALEAAESGAALTQGLLAFSRRQVLQPQSVDVGRLVAETTKLYRRTLGETIEVKTEVPKGLWRCHADPAQLETALLNLAINARDAMPGGGCLTIVADNVAHDETDVAHDPSLAAGEYVRIAITDTGTGMDPAVAARVFEPFFTTKDIGKGSGLGLSMVYGFAQQSGGCVRIYSEMGHGTTVRLYLPRAQAGKQEPAAAQAGIVTRGGGRKILVVEDNPQMLQVSVSILRSLGYEPVEATNANEALAILDATAGIEVLFTDIVLGGGMNGIELAAEARRRRPDLKVLYTSGFPNIDRVAGPSMACEIDILTKPFRASELAKRLADV